MLKKEIVVGGTYRARILSDLGGKIMPNKIDWLKMEMEMREVLSDSDISTEDAISCLDEILARYTRRGNCVEMPAVEYDRLKNQYPKYFDWGIS